MDVVLKDIAWKRWVMVGLNGLNGLSKSKLFYDLEESVKRNLCSVVTRDCLGTGLELEPMIVMDPFPLSIFYDSRGCLSQGVPYELRGSEQLF